MRTRRLKFPTFPKLDPSTDMMEPPDDTLLAETREEKAGVTWAAFNVSEVTALNATLNVRSGILPLSDAMRHNKLESLDQNEPAQADAANRAPGDEAMLANARPERVSIAPPVVGICGNDAFISNGSG